MMSLKVTIWKFKRHHGTGLFLGHVQPPLDKIFDDLVILVLEFDDVTVKTIYCFLSSLEWDPEGDPVGGLVWAFTFCTDPSQDLLKSSFNSTHEPSLN